MKDLPALFKAFVVPYIACYSFTLMGYLWATGQDIPQLVWVIFLGALGELGIEIGATKIIKKIKK